jgi:DNA-binding transcriptional ArsR family regulator
VTPRRRAAGGPELARLAGLLADGTRASFLITLLDGRARTAGELARAAGVAASTASDHLTQLVAGGLLIEERQGRHRYVRLADARTAALVEAMQAFTAPATPVARTLRESAAFSAMARARTCYDHLAGRLGVQIYDGLVDRGLLERSDGLAITETGMAWLDEMGIDVAGMRKRQRPIVRECLDWTERRPHLAGAAGAALCTRFFDRRWIERIGSGRAVRITAEGTRGLAELGFQL